MHGEPMLLDRINDPHVAHRTLQKTPARDILQEREGCSSKIRETAYSPSLFGSLSIIRTIKVPRNVQSLSLYLKQL
jgi:hypothetical protein